MESVLPQPERSTRQESLINDTFVASPRGSVKDNVSSGEECDDVDRVKAEEEERWPIDETEMTLPQILEEVDDFLRRHQSEEGESSSSLAEMPKAIELLSKRVESMITKYGSSSRLGSDRDNEVCLFESITRLSRLTNKLKDVSSENNGRTDSVLQGAMLFFEDELRSILDKQSEQNDKPESKSIKTKTSFNSALESDRCLIERNSSVEDELLPILSPDAISLMNRICTSMIEAGYETECCMVYSVSRRNVFKSAQTKLGMENINMEDVHKMPWESLEGEISTWIFAIKQCLADLFPVERKLCESVFSGFPHISRSMFSNLMRSVAIRLLNFAEAVVLTKLASEKLFKFLDMYETLRDLVSSLDESYKEDAAEEVRDEMESAKTRIGEAAVRIFCDLENSINSDNGRTPVPSGAVHPLTRYTMNYLKYACEYKETLEQVFRQHQDRSGNGDDVLVKGNGESSPFAAELMSVMDLLDGNLDMKSKLYRDPSLSYIFLMNNGRYILQKIKSTPEIRDLMGDTWCRKRSSDLRHYHKSYQRETWYQLLQCLSHEGLMVSGKVLKPALKEKFKAFNATFDEIHKTQSAWVVNDKQMQSELRVSIAAVVTPAYRSFLGRFSQYLDSGRQSEKYIKYQPEDIEGFIDELFDGNAASMGRRKS